MRGPFHLLVLLFVLQCSASEENARKPIQNGDFQKNPLRNGTRNGGIMQAARNAKNEKQSPFPSSSPSNAPSSYPSSSPSDAPSSYPSSSPSDAPSSYPSSSPSDAPSSYPSSSPSDAPSSYPSSSPTMFPTAAPTYENPETCDICPAPKVVLDQTKREGLGESPGIPNLVHLGLGYNIFEGNPRGSDIAEVDPGFRSGVIQLIQEQTSLTVDGQYTVPLGVDVRYITACKFASKATEISSESEYQSEVSKEASQSFEGSVGVSFPLYSVSKEYAFSSSQKFKEFKQTTESKESVNYEARALCSEFKASLQPFVSHARTERFKRALDNLPLRYDSTNMEHRETYIKFFAAFGTHYVKDVTLGAKHIFSSEINSEDVSDLEKEEVDISSTLSWSVQASLGGGGGGNEAYGELVRSETSVEASEGVSASSSVYSYVFEDPSVGGGKSGEETVSENEQTSSLEKIRRKVTTVTELNVGGNPPEDGNWKTWATTVRDRPMPISYELGGIWELMSGVEVDSKINSFYLAIVDIYNIDLRARANKNILEKMRFGVARSNGEPISSYNRDPSSNFRSNLRLSATNGNSIGTEQTSERQFVTTSDKNFNIGNSDNCEFSGFKGFDSIDQKYACGMQVATLSQNGITRLGIVFCSEGWAANNIDGTLWLNDRSDSTTKISQLCDAGEFIIGIEGQNDTEETGGSCSGFADNCDGIDALTMICTTPAGGTKKVLVGKGNDADEDKKAKFSFERSQLKTANRDQYRINKVNVRACSEDVGLGLVDIRFEYANAGLERRYATYKYDVTRETNTVPAFFASPVRENVGRNAVEEYKSFGFGVRNAKKKGDVLNVMSYYPFGIFSRGKSQIVIQDFKDERIRDEELQSFSFLSAENLPSEEKYIAGVVHPDGYATNDRFGNEDIGFTVGKLDFRKFEISFSDESMDNPTFLAFPLWFSGPRDAVPQEIGDVAIAIEQCSNRVCSLQVGENFVGKPKEYAKNRLGFSFLALSGDLNSDVVGGIAHGVVTLVIGSTDLVSETLVIDADQSPKQGLEYENYFASSFNAQSTDRELFLGQPTGQSRRRPYTSEIAGGLGNTATLTFKSETSCCTGGILIRFNKRFDGLPSVVVNPIVGDRQLDLNGGEIDKVAMPYAVVETLTEEYAFVKAYWIDTTKGADSYYESLSFHIVAVGPQRDDLLPTKSPTSAPTPAT